MRGVRRVSLIFLLAALASSAGTAEPIDYIKDVKPVLKSRCFACHGALKQQANLRLDTLAAMQKGGDSGPGVKAGDLAGSLVITRITHADPAERMPPEGEPPLKPEQIASLKTWIEQGARGIENEQPEPDPRQHWAFQKPARATLIVPPRTVLANSIYVLVEVDQASEALLLLGPEDRPVVVGRVTLD